MISRRIEYFSSVQEAEEIETSKRVSKYLEIFSLAQDLLMSKRSIKDRFKLLINEYSRYIKSKKNTISEIDLDHIDQLLISKFNQLVNAVEEDILKNKPLSIILGMKHPKLIKSSTKFSKEYKKLLMSRNKLGYIPIPIQKSVDKLYKEVIGELRNIVFAPVINMFSYSEVNDAMSGVDIEEVKLSSKVTDDQLTQMIIGIFRKENLDIEIEKIDDNSFILTLKKS